jgi:hypothetical protein
VGPLSSLSKQSAGDRGVPLSASAAAAAAGKKDKPGMKRIDPKDIQVGTLIFVCVSYQVWYDMIWWYGMVWCGVV